jgi:ATP adenylyltransferase
LKIDLDTLIIIKVEIIMDNMWSPWRSQYIETFKDENSSSGDNCFICEAISNTSEDLLRHVVARRNHVIVLMNKYPYNNGHLLIAPLNHISKFEDLNQDEMLQVMQTINDSIKVMDNTIKPHGYNIGVNIGRSSGAGLPGHIHFHVVPRWNGDTNFMSVLSDVKVISQSMAQTQELLTLEFNKL